MSIATHKVMAPTALHACEAGVWIEEEDGLDEDNIHPA
jgi:hypothetical protein